MAAVVLLLLLVVWPYWRRIDAELSTPQQQVKENVPVSAVFLFDTSLSMEYRLESKTRLDRARQMAETYLDHLPPRSRVAIGDLSEDTPILFQADLTSALSRIKGMKTAAVSRAVNSRVRDALLLQEEDRRRTQEEDSGTPEELRQDRYVREVYLFTDMARSAWRQEDAKLLHSEMERMPWVSAYLIDVGVKQPANVGISAVRLPRQTLSEGSDLVIEASLDAVGVEGAARTVEVFLKTEAGLVKKGQSTVTVDTQAGAKLAFTIPGVKGPMAQGEVRLIASDPLPADDVRYFTVAVKPAPEILLVGEKPDDAYFWRLALAPSELERLGKARYKCEFVTPGKLDTIELAKYDSVCLFNVRAPSGKAWDALAKYVASGGGLAVFLGSTRIDPVSYNAATAQSVLPGELLAHLRFPNETFLDLQNLAHPIVHKFEDLGGAGELTSSPVLRYWRVKPHDGATVVAPYTDERESAAIIERPHGQGRVVMFTTGVDLQGDERQRWSELPLARWSFIALADQTMQYLAHAGDGVYNYSAGEGVVLPIDRRHPVHQYLLRKPGLEQLPGEVGPDSTAIVIDKADQVGPYEVVSTEKDVPFASGFSVNVPAGESDFTRITEADLDVFLGEKRYRVAEDIGTLERIVSTGRLGEEMFPFVVGFLLAAFLAEHLAANYFYEAEQTPVHQ